MMNLKATSTNTETNIKLAQAVYTLNQRKKRRPIDFFNPIDDPELNQKAFFESDKRNKGAFGGNRTGKTLSGAAYVLKKCLDFPDQDWWGATWADMSVPVQQREIYKLLPKDNSVRYAKFSEQRGFANKIIMFSNGSRIRFKTYDQGRESFQGTAKDGIWLDEEPPEDIVNECKARLIDRNGEMIRTMTPLNGITYTFDEMVLNEKNDPEVAYWFFDSEKNPYINTDAQKRIIGNFAEKEAEVRQKGHFVNLTTGNAYYPFTENNIITVSNPHIQDYYYNDGFPLEVSCDFNIDLMCWNIGQEINGVDYTFDFVELEGQANTDRMCLELKAKTYEGMRGKFQSHNGHYIFYVDIAGSQRHPEASKTNIAIIQEHFPHADIFYQKIKNIKDRIDSTNSRICNSNKQIRYYVHERCKRLIKDYRQVTWEHLLNKNKAGKLTHASDGESYRMHYKYDLTGKPVVSTWKGI
jgi:phage terminase large subunit-like protein